MLFFNLGSNRYLLAAGCQREFSHQDEGHVHDLHPRARAGVGSHRVTGQEEDEEEENISQPGRKRQRKRGHK